jgi:multisubunit Na+/H+ antiporter MnhB subunit
VTADTRLPRRHRTEEPPMLTRLHLTAAATAATTTVLFILAAISTALLDRHHTVDVRQAMLWGLLVLVPVLLITVATGFRMAGTSVDPRMTAKKRRMAFIAGIGLLLLTPAAFALHQLAPHGDFGAPYLIVQTVEALATATSLALMAANIRDGLRLTARR